MSSLLPHELFYEDFLLSKVGIKFALIRLSLNFFTQQCIINTEIV